MTLPSTGAYGIRQPPFETADLRDRLARFLDTVFPPTIGPPMGDALIKIGNYRWGVYAFYDYEGEPIYCGQTNEMLRTRIRRHLTNQRTDAVAMSVLDPFEVYEIEVWPLAEHQDVRGKGHPGFRAAKTHLDALERVVTEAAVARSRFGAILNEKDPPAVAGDATPPPSFRDRVVSDRVRDLRSHPDFRIARRSLIISRLAQVIAERQVQGGLRRVLLTQAKRLQWLASARYEGLGGAASVAAEEDEDDDAGEG